MHKNTCCLCGKIFDSTYKRTLLCHSPHEKYCLNCGSVFYVTSETRSKKFCCLDCSAQYRKKTGQNKEIVAKIKKTKLDRYGTLSAPVDKKPRKCAICGEYFTPTSNHQSTCSKIHYGPCPICGKPSKVYNLQEGPVCCSNECKMKLVQQKVKDKYGSYANESIQNKRRKTSLHRYGNEVYQRTDNYKEKTNRTNLLRYGVDWYVQSDNFKKKRIETCQKRYGGIPTQTGHSYSVYKKNCLNKYGVEHPSKLESSKMHYTEVCKSRYGVPTTLSLDKAVENMPWRVSSNNIHFMNLLNGLSIQGEFEYLLSGFRYDIGVPSMNTVFEINPTETHNSYKTIRGHEGLDSYYHLERTIAAESCNFRCVHVWDWDNWDKVVRLVLPIFRKVPARRCNVVELDRKVTDGFLNENHLQGSCRGQAVRLGLTYNEELVQVMTFGRPRYNRRFEWELLRLCSLSGTFVTGGASKLFSYFTKNFNPVSILSYCDRSKFTGKVYRSIGMSLADEGTPNKHWYSPRKSEKMQHITNNFLMQRGFDQIFGTSFGKGTSNEQLMLDRGYLFVYDCGQMRFEWHQK